MERVRNTRELVTIKASRKRGEFKNMCKFGDRDAHDGFLECRPYRDANYDLIRMEVNMAVQAVPELVNTSAQTAWFRPINFACQYEPAIMPRDEQDYIIHSSSMSDFLQTVAVRFEQGLQQNTLTNIFRDDYTHLGEEEMTLEQGAHTVLQEYQSFTDLVHSKDRCISCIDWHPAQKGVLAISCTQRVSFEERVEHGFNVRSKQSLIIVWSFHDPIHPQLILEAPEDVHAFRFNPVDPNIVVGGCANGQIVLWDISEYQDKLKSARKTDGEGVGAGSDESKDRQVETPVLKYSVVSSIEASHRAAIMDIHWLPQNFELASNGEPLEHGDNGHKQLLTASLDGTIAFWDLRFKKDWRSLDLAWRPFLRVPLSALDNTYDYSLTKVSVRASLLEKTKNADTEGSQRDAPSSAGKEKEKAPPAQKPWTSKFYCATEEGDLIYSDWIAEKTTEEKASRVETAFSMHYGPMSDLQRSPFFPDILLSVGGWSFHIWKEKTTTGPLVSSAPAPAYLIAGHWSPTRPGVFYIGRADGVLEVWDLLDTSHAPSTTQNITSTAISNLQIHQYGGKSSTGQQFIAAGDDAGTLHILEIPRNLQKQSKNEKSVISAFFEREGRRLAYSNGRKQQRVRERAGFEAALLEATASAAKAAAAAAAAAPKPEATAAVAAEGQSAPAPATTAADDEEDKAEQEFLKLERAFLEAEGLIAAPI
ncbi:WD40-repeat-containing domain protein [Entophlyctis helioformis]|nr:WD40-repeat-containing domain protein [Entophlyctis helioformis]